jgi:hypothetical protein
LSDISLPARRPLPPERGTVVRAYSPRGFYWKQSVALPSAIYANQTDLILTACVYDDRWQSDSEFYSENELLKLEEVRLLASLMLPLDVNQGWAVLHPLPCELLLPQVFDLSEEYAQALVSKEIRTRLSKGAFAGYDYLSLPPIWDTDKAYEYRGDPLPVGLQGQIYDAIDTTDHLLIRGLYGLIRCAMLMRYDLFREEATLALYVSLDASFSIVTRCMSAEGLSNPSAYDAGEWIANAFGEEYVGNKYFEEYYDDRIRAMHPNSRFGVFPFAPLSADDCYFLFESLRDVYRLLILRTADRPAVE